LSYKKPQWKSSSRSYPIVWYKINKFAFSINDKKSQIVTVNQLSFEICEGSKNYLQEICGLKKHSLISGIIKAKVISWEKWPSIQRVISGHVAIRNIEAVVRIINGFKSKFLENQKFSWISSKFRGKSGYCRYDNMSRIGIGDQILPQSTIDVIHVSVKLEKSSQ